MKKILMIVLLAIGSFAAKAQVPDAYDLVNFSSCDVIVYYYDHLPGDCGWLPGPPGIPPHGTFTVPGAVPGSPTIVVPPPPPMGMVRSYFVHIGTCIFGPVGNYGPPMCGPETVAIIPNLAGCDSNCPHIGEVWAHPGGWLGIF